MDEIKEKLNRCGMCDEYYLAFDKPSNVTYDYYVEGEEEEKPSILINKKGKIKSIIRFSESIRAISGNQEIKYFLYFPRKNYDAYGPYSDTLTVKLEELKSMNIIEEIKDESGAFPKYTYRLKIEDNDIKNGLENIEV